MNKEEVLEALEKLRELDNAIYSGALTKEEIKAIEFVDMFLSKLYDKL